MTNMADDAFLFKKFDSSFLWGAATSAYQIEGAWNADSKFRLLVFHQLLEFPLWCSVHWL